MGMQKAEGMEVGRVTDKEKKARKEARVEIKARKLIIKKLNTAIDALQKTANRQKAEKQAEREKLLEYKTYKEAQDAYGWGLIDEEEFDKITSFIESSQSIVDEPTAEEIAVKTLQDWLHLMGSEIASLEFEMLPKEEQRRILDNNLRILEEREKRRKARENQ